MDNFVDFLANRVVMNITKIRNSAANYNGRCTWHFSQCKDPVRTIIGKAATSADGICEIVAAKWAALEIGNAQTLQSWLTGGQGGARDHLDKARISLLAQTFGTGEGNQENTTEAWLRSQGVTPFGATDMGGAAVRGAGKVNIQDMLDEIRARVGRLANPLIGLMTIAEENNWIGYKGHIMAFRAEAGGNPPVKFFDPNYGDFEFNTYANFKNWFDYYFRESHYRAFLGSYYKVRYLH